jgi:hypothetical protein
LGTRMKSMGRFASGTHLQILSLPHGFVTSKNSKNWIRQIRMRKLDGYDEQYLQHIIDLPSPIKTSKLLARVILLGGYNSFNCYQRRLKFVRNLTIGDREFLMLQLHRITYGDRLQFVIGCPKCKESLSLDLLISDVLKPQHDKKILSNNEYDLKIHDTIVKIRPLTGKDQELIALENRAAHKNCDRNASNGINELEQLLISKCIIGSVPKIRTIDCKNTTNAYNHEQTLSVAGSLGLDYSEYFIQTLGSKLSEIDPYADLVFDICCPLCQFSFQVPFSAEHFVLEQIELSSKYMEREIHCIAFNYHWDERTILSLPLTKRKRYVELINETLINEAI